MKSSAELYTRVSTKLRSLNPTLHQIRLANWVWVIVGLVLAAP
jgi:hypothetical protein